MKSLLAAALATVTLLGAVAPAVAFTLTGPADVTVGISFDWTYDGSIVERRRPRVPGGSGCDDPRDLIEHPECRR